MSRKNSGIDMNQELSPDALIETLQMRHGSCKRACSA